LLTCDSTRDRDATAATTAVDEPSGLVAPVLSLDDLTRTFVPLIEREIAVALEREVGDRWMRAAIGYQFGWNDTEFASLAPDQRRSTGKRLRPVLTLLCYLAAIDAPDAGALEGAAGADAVTFAAAVEMIHNFSLIHDDIEDRDQSRRGRPTLWALCGEAQAINVGDCVQALAHASLGRLRGSDRDRNLVGELVHALAKATIDTTIGQRRDMTYESTTEVDAEMYAAMIAGKTAALMSCATYGGARLAVDDDPAAVARRAAGYADFGRELGLCFQVRDDVLGIWGVEAETGKASGGDIRRRKKSLPIVLALGTATGAERRRIAELYALEVELDNDQEGEVRRLLHRCDAERLAQDQATLHAERALLALARANAGRDDNHFVATLRSLSDSLTSRSR
jgi:geranylgeranyl diphosphate synthase type I